MKRNSPISAALISIALIANQHADAHHASSGLYDRETLVTIQGEIVYLSWRNPHVRFTLSISSEDGLEEEWEIEAGSVNTLERIGISEEYLKPGSVVEVRGSAGRGGQTIMFADSIVSAQGQELQLNAAIEERYARPEFDAETDLVGDSAGIDLFRVWVPRSVPNSGAGLIELPLTEAARAARSAWNPVNDPALRCIPPGMPAAMDNPYPIAFEDHGESIILRLEEWDGVRTIYLEGETAPIPEPSPMGYSVGHWEDDRLVVETSLIDYPYFDDLGTPQSELIHVTEYFDLDSDRRQLSWRAEIVDPVNFTDTVVQDIQWQWIPGNVIKRFDCALPDNE